MKLPKVSIVVPIYNAEAYLKECLISIVSQTYDNIEIICIDDGSQDNSYKVVETYAEIDDRIVLIRQANKGVAAARNVGLNVATGDYMMSCDADDYLQPDAVELCITKLMTHDECEAVFFNSTQFTQYGWSLTGIEGEAYANIPADIVCATSNFLGCFGNVCFAIFSLQTIRKSNILFREGFIYEDWDFVAHFLSKAKRIYWLNGRLYNYRWAQNSSICGDVTEKCLDIFTTMSFVEEHFKEAGRWENNQYSFYIKALGHLLYFKRDRLPRAKEDVKKAFDEKASEFIQAIPYTMLCSLVHFFPMADRVSILKLHPDHDIEVQFCLDNLKRQKRAAIRARIKSFFKKILMMIFPAYRVAVNSRYEMEQMHGELMGKLNEITWLQYENRKDINLILRKLGVDKEARITEEILVARENENYIK